MDRYTIEQKMKSAAAFLVIIILLPYIISVFVNGADAAAGEGSVFYVKVKVPDTEEADGIAEIGWTDCLAGILAKEVPEDFGEEAMKAQAVVIRTQIYRELESSGDKILTLERMTLEEMKKQWGQEKALDYYNKYIRAVEQTDDTVLMYGDGYAWTPFHQSSSGMTRSAAEVMGTEEFPYVTIRRLIMRSRYLHSRMRRYRRRAVISLWRLMTGSRRKKDIRSPILRSRNMILQDMSAGFGSGIRSVQVISSGKLWGSHPVVFLSVSSGKEKPGAVSKSRLPEMGMDLA